jgi:ABC-type oligopeptide transport system substrate-binding subunit
LSKEKDPEQGKDESDEDFFKRWKKHVKEEKDSPQAGWLKDAIGKEVEVYSNRAPSVHGVVRKLDLRFGKVLIENDTEVVEISLGAIQQVRFPK